MPCKTLCWRRFCGRRLRRNALVVLGLIISHSVRVGNEVHAMGAASEQEREELGQPRAGGSQLTSLALFGRCLPPWTDGSAHHLAARRRTPT